MIFKKKTKANIVADDRELIETNNKTVGNLTMLVENNEELVCKLKDLQEKLKYLKPVNTKEAMKVDINISDKIDDIKLELSRFGSDTCRRVNNLISDIILLLVNRND